MSSPVAVHSRSTSRSAADVVTHSDGGERANTPHEHSPPARLDVDTPPVSTSPPTIKRSDSPPPTLGKRPRAASVSGPDNGPPVIEDRKYRGDRPLQPSEYESGRVICETCSTSVSFRDEHSGEFTLKHWDAHRVTWSVDSADYFSFLSFMSYGRGTAASQILHLRLQQSAVVPSVLRMNASTISGMTPTSPSSRHTECCVPRATSGLGSGRTRPIVAYPGTPTVRAVSLRKCMYSIAPTFHKILIKFLEPLKTPMRSNSATPPSQRIQTSANLTLSACCAPYATVGCPYPFPTTVSSGLSTVMHVGRALSAIITIPRPTRVAINRRRRHHRSLSLSRSRLADRRIPRQSRLHRNHRPHPLLPTRVGDATPNNAQLLFARTPSFFLSNQTGSSAVSVRNGSNSDKTRASVPIRGYSIAASV